MDDFQKRFPRTVAMVESRIAAQNTMESAQHIHQQAKHKIKPLMCHTACFYNMEKFICTRKSGKCTKYRA